MPATRSTRLPHLGGWVAGAVALACGGTVEAVGEVPACEPRCVRLAHDWIETRPGAGVTAVEVESCACGWCEWTGTGDASLCDGYQDRRTFRHAPDEGRTCYLCAGVCTSAALCRQLQPLSCDGELSSCGGPEDGVALEYVCTTSPSRYEEACPEALSF